MTHWLPMVAAVAAALLAAIVLWPLRQQGRRSFVLGVVTLGVAGACLYLLVGNPRAAQVQPAPSVATLRDGVEALQQALQRDPQRADGWALLGRSQAELGNVAAAADAFNRAAALAPDEPGVLVEAAQARAQADPGKQFDDTALAWLQRARTLSPDAERASWLLGIALRQRGRNAEAAELWSTLLPRLEPGAAQALQAQIAIAREAAGQPSHAPASAPALLQVRVQLPASLKAGAGTRGGRPADAGGCTQAAPGRLPCNGRSRRRRQPDAYRTVVGTSRSGSAGAHFAQRQRQPQRRRPADRPGQGQPAA